MDAIKRFIAIGNVLLTFAYFLYAAKWWMILFPPIGGIVWIGIELGELFKHGNIPWFTIFLGITGWLLGGNGSGTKYVSNIKWIIGGIVLVGVIFVLLTFAVVHTEPFASKLEETYFQRLDEWARGKGAIEEVNTVIVPTCGRLVTVLSTTAENVGFLSTHRDDWDFRIDVCAKMTANRVHHQPEFEKPETVEMICDQSKVELFTKLCRRSGLR